MGIFIFKKLENMKLIKVSHQINYIFDEIEWKRIKQSFMQKDFGESMCKETKHNILKFFEEKLR